MCISMYVKIRHKLIEIEDRVSDRFVILITNYRWLRILEVIRYRRSNRPTLKNTKQNLLFAYAKKGTDQLHSNCAADQCLIFCYKVSAIPIFLNPKFQASSHLLCLYSPVSTDPCRKPQGHVFL